MVAQEDRDQGSFYLMICYCTNIDTMQVNDYLKFHGYEFTAVPDNYIEQPPENLDSVRTNLEIVTRALDPVAPPDISPVSLIKELRDEVSNKFNY